MYQDASFAALPPTDTGLAVHGASAPARRPTAGLTWRHVATGGLLLVALPVFAVAALVCLPVLLVAAGAQSLWRVWALARSAPHAHDSTPTPSL
jgi:hypothetical protein